MEAEKSGESLDDELQIELVQAIKLGIQLTNPLKGVNVSTLGGNVYVRDLLDGPKQKKFSSVALVAFIKRRKNDFWIPEGSEEDMNPTVRVMDDVRAAEA